MTQEQVLAEHAKIESARAEFKKAEEAFDKARDEFQDKEEVFQELVKNRCTHQYSAGSSAVVNTLFFAHCNICGACDM